MSLVAQVVKNPPSNAGDMTLIPGWGAKTSHATEQLSWHTANRESPQATTKSLHSQNSKKKLSYFMGYRERSKVRCAGKGQSD